MEAEETSNDQAKECCQKPCRSDEISKLHIIILLRQDSNENGVCSGSHKQTCKRGIKKHIQEVFVVVESDTVCNPWTMVVHFKNTLITLRAMMASVRLRP